MISFSPLSFPADEEALVSFLTSEEWPFHVNLRLSREKAHSMIAEGIFSGSNHESFWIKDEGVTIGFLRLTDLDDVDDGFPLFDLRIKAAQRRRGVGAAAVKWIADYLFGKYPGLDRIAASTRADNLAMRKVLRRSGFAKEGHSRQSWPGEDRIVHDSVTYGILRSDWEQGTLTPVHWEDEA
jgi:RimJ/RimL family protein N-acetyltransferase